MTSTLEKCQGHERQGETEKLSQIRADRGDGTSTCGILDSVLEEEKGQ